MHNLNLIEEEKKSSLSKLTLFLYIFTTKTPYKIKSQIDQLKLNKANRCNEILPLHILRYLSK